MAAGSQPAARPETTAVTAGRIPFDLTCLYCGHNLRGLRPDGVCTECGRPIVLSVRGSRLGAADPKWVRALRNGSGLLLMALPWVWLPPAWIVVLVGGWYLTRAEARGGHGDTLAAVLRGVLLFLVGIPALVALGLAGDAALEEAAAVVMFTGCGLVVWMSLAAWRLRALVAGRWLRRTLALLAWCALLSLLTPLLVAADLQPPGADEKVILEVGGAVGAVALALNVLLTVPALVFLWRELRAADVLASCPGPLIRRGAWGAAGAVPAAATPPPAAGAASHAPA